MEFKSKRTEPCGSADDVAPIRPKTLIDRLPAEVTGASLLPVIEKLRQGPCKITLDASKVTKLGPSGLEALLVLANTQTKQGNKFSVENPSQELLADLALMAVGPEQLKGTSP